MDQELDRRTFWDEQSCAEFEQMLDSREVDEEDYSAWVESKQATDNRDCPVHGRF